MRRRELIERLQRGRRAERSWNDELRAQLQREHESHGELDEAGGRSRSDPAGGDRAGRGREGIAAVARRRGRRRPSRPRVRARVRARSGAQLGRAALRAGGARSRPDRPRGHAGGRIRSGRRRDREPRRDPAVPARALRRRDRVRQPATTGSRTSTTTCCWRSATMPAPHCRASASNATCTTPTAPSCECWSACSTPAIPSCAGRPGNRRCSPAPSHDGSISSSHELEVIATAALLRDVGNVVDPGTDPAHARSAVRRTSARSWRCTRASAPACSTSCRPCTTSPPRCATTTSASTAPATRPVSAATRSRSPRGCSPSSTPTAR